MIGNMKKVISLLLSVLIIFNCFNLTMISAFAASNESDFEFDSSTGTITSYKGAGGEVVVPESIGGVKVTSLGRNAFSKRIDDNTYSGNSTITSIEIPSSVSSIDSRCFDGCNALKEIIVNTENSNYKSENGVLFNKSGSELISYPRKKAGEIYSIPNSVTSIGGNAFYHCNGLTSIEISSSVTSIGSFAFMSCSSLTSIEIPNSVTSIDSGVFFGCSNLTSILIPSSVTSIGSQAFENCSSLESIKIPNSVTSIDHSAFMSCSSLTSIEIPSSITSIDHSAFKNCSSLTSITIPSSVTRIENDILYGVSATIYCVKGSTADNASLYPESCKIEYITEASAESDFEFDSATGTITGYKGAGGEVVIPESIGGIKVTIIGDKAFQNNETITNLILQKGITKISDYAFYCCSKLVSVEIPSSVSKIESHVFNNCRSLENINVSELNQSYKSEDGILFNKEKTELVKYPSGKSDTKYIIPNDIKNIGSNAFNECTNLTSIEIPDSVTSIDNSAFYGCNGLTSIEIPNSVTNIDNYAFMGCHNLTNVEIPSSVTSMGVGVFNSCSGLTSLTIPKSVTSIGSDILNGVSNATIYCVKGSTADNASLYPESCTIEYITEASDESDFEFDSATGTITSYKGAGGEVVVPESIGGVKVTILGKNAFWGNLNKKITSIEIPDSVTSISDGCFNYCNNLVKITVDAENKNYKSENGILFNKDGTKLIRYPECKSDTVYEIPDSVIDIGNSAFANCGNLINIEISDSVINIDNNAFFENSNLKEINVNSLNKNYKSENGVLFNKLGTKLIKYPENKNEKTYAILDGVTQIENRAFYRCRNLTGIEISNSVTSIGNEAFEICDSLKSIKLPNNITSIGDFAFASCLSLESIEIPSSVTSIGENILFYVSNATIYCVKGSTADNASLYPESCTIEYITEASDESDFEFDSATGTITGYKGAGGEVVVPESIGGVKVTSLGKFAFWQNVNGGYNANSTITSIEISGSVSSINSYCFDGCSVLKEIIVDTENNNYKSDDGILFNKSGSELIKYPKGKTEKTYSIPSSVTSIGDIAFGSCSSITSITIPSSITSIGSSAFMNCSSLISIEIPSSITSISDGVFSYCSSLTSIEIPSSITSIGNSAFMNCSSLTSIEIPSSVTSIGESTFTYCSNLTSITIPSSVTSIGSSAFMNCGSLTSIEIPSSVIGISDGAFSYCSDLTSIEIPSSITSIGDRAFIGCSSLTNIEIPNSVTNIGKFAFYGCSDLKSITIPNSVTSIGKNILYNVSNATIYCVKGSTADNASLYPESCKIEYITEETTESTTEATTEGTTSCFEFDSSTGTLKGYKGSDVDVVIPATINGVSVIKIDLNAFGTNDIIKSVTIPSSVETIGQNPFRNVKRLTTINVDEANASFKSVDGVLFSKDGTELRAYPNEKGTEYVIPNGVKIIGHSAFRYNSNLTNITIPNTVTSINDVAFSRCTGLSNVEIPNSVTSIGRQAFRGCNSLKSITIPSSVISIANDVLEIVDEDITATIYCVKGSTADNADLYPSSCKIEYISDPNAKYTLSYNATGGSNAPSAVTAKAGESLIISEAIPEKAGYIFAGWAEKENGEVKYQPKDSITLNEDVTLYAVWTTTQYTLKYDLNGGSDAYIPEQKTQPGSTDLTISDIVPDRLPFNFKGWATSKTATEAEYMPKSNIRINSDTVLYAVWENAEIISSIKNTVQVTAKFSLSEYYYFECEPSISTTYFFKTGSISGKNPKLEIWTDSSAGKTKIDESSSNYTDGSLEKQYELERNKKYYIRIYNVNNNELPITIKRICTINYDVNGGENKPESQKVAFGDIVKISSTIPTKYGYIFNGWTTEKDSSNVEYQPNDEYSVNQNSVTFYAVWSKDTRYIPKRDNYSFANNATSFGYNMENGYKIPVEVYFEQQNKQGVMVYDNDYMNTEWKGSCYGMSSSALLFYLNLLDKKAYNINSDNLYETPQPKDSNSVLTKLIEKLQISQYINNVIVPSRENNNDVDGLISAVKNFENKGTDPIILNMFMAENGYALGHTVVPYKCVVDENGDYNIYVSDNNYPGDTNRKVVISKNKSHLSYDRFNFNIDENYKNHFHFIYVKELYDAVNDAALNPLSDDEIDENIFVSTNSKNFSIVNSDNQSLKIVYNNGDVTNTIGDKAYEIVSSEGEYLIENKNVLYNIPAGKYVVTNYDDSIESFEVSISNNKDYQKAKTNSLNSNIEIGSNDGTGRLYVNIFAKNVVAGENINSVNVLSDNNTNEYLESSGKNLYVHVDDDKIYASTIDNSSILHNGEILQSTEVKQQVVSDSVSGDNEYSVIKTDSSRLKYANHRLKGSLGIYVNNNVNKMTDARVIVGLYTKDGKQIDLLYDNNQVLAYGKNYINVGSDITISNLPEDEYYVKCFVWDSLGYMTPIADVLEIAVEK